MSRSYSHDQPLSPFPYTTLFRSQAVECMIAIDDAGPAGGGARKFHCRLGRLRAGVCEEYLVEMRHQRKKPLGQNARQDRKSTRLNSSHVRISYAVFCLKK